MLLAGPCYFFDLLSESSCVDQTGANSQLQIVAEFEKTNRTYSGPLIPTVIFLVAGQMPTESRRMLRALCCCCNCRSNRPPTYRCKMCPSSTSIYFRQPAPSCPGFWWETKADRSYYRKDGKHANWITQCQHDFIFFDVWDWLWCIKRRRHSKMTWRHLVNKTCITNPRQCSTGNINLQYLRPFSDFAKPAVCMNLIINRVTNHKNMIFNMGLRSCSRYYWTS